LKGPPPQRWRAFFAARPHTGVAGAGNAL